MSQTEHDETVALPDPRTSRRLYQTGLTGLVAAVAGLVYKSDLVDPILLSLGAIIMIIGAWPALTWARRGDLHFPVFEIFMLTSIPFYAVPILAGHPTMLQFSAGATWNAAVSMLLFQLCAVAAFSGTRVRPGHSRSMGVSLLPATALRYASTGIFLNTVYLYVRGFTDLVPNELATVLRAIFFGIGTVALFVEMRRWGAGQLRGSEQAIISLNLLVQLIFLFRDLYLIVGISLLLLALIGYISTSRRIPIAVLVVVLPIVAVLHNGKTVMRTLYWEGRAPAPTLTELPIFFENWFLQGLADPTEEEASSNSLAGRLFERASLFQMLCLVTERTPENEPYLAGESYKYVFAQLVPRILWPGKPSSLESNILLAVHYGLVSRDSPASVSIAFGMIAESYANFGLIGCAVLGLLLGHAYKRISVAAIGLPQFSGLGLLTILLAAWSFQVEQIFATWLVSLLQAAFVVIGGPMMFRTFFGQE